MGRLVLIVALTIFAGKLFAQPVINFNSGGNTIGCAPNPITYSISGQINSFTNYTVDFGDGTPAQPYTNLTLPSSLTHIYTSISCGETFTSGGVSCPNAFGATLTGTNSITGAQGSWVVYPIGISQPPLSSFTLTPNPVCAGTPITFTNTSFPGNVYSPTGAPCNSVCDSANAFYWELTGPSTGTIITGNQGSTNGFPADWDIWSSGTRILTMQFSVPGTYVMKLYVGNACTQNISISTHNFCVVAPPSPQFSLNPTTGCLPPNLNVAATNATTVTPNACFPTTYSYNWSVLPATGWTFNAPGTATSTNTGFTFNTSGNYTVSLNASVNNLPGCAASVSQPLSITQAPIVDAGNNISVCAGGPTVQLTGSPAGGSWSGTGVNSTGLYTPAGSAGSAVLTYTLPASGCPAQSDLLTVTINPLPVIAITPAVPSICQGGSVNLNATSNIAGTTFTWSPSTGLNTVTGTPVIASPGNTTTYSVSGVAPVTGCAGSFSVPVTVNPNPLVNVPSPAAICPGAQVTLTASGSSGLGPYTYSWSPSTGLSATSGVTVNANPNATTAYTVTITDSRGCTGQTTVMVTVHNLPTVSAGPDVPVCNTPTPYTLTGASPGNGTWTGPNVTTTGVFTPSGIGTFTLTYTVTTNGCPVSDLVNLIVANPTAANAGTDQNLCVSVNPINLSGSPVNGTWSGSPLVTSAGVFTPSAAGTYLLTYSYGAGNCAVTDTKTIIVYGLPAVTVNDPTVCQGITASLTANGSAGLAPYTYSWSPAAGLSPATGANVTATTASSTNYTVTITDAHNCTNTDVATITVTPVPAVVAGFDVPICNTPNPYTLVGATPAGGTWSGSPQVSPGGIFTPNGIGSYVLTYSVTVDGCTGSDVLTLSVNNPQTANAGADTGICLNSSALNLVATPAGGAWSGSPFVTSSGVFSPTTVGSYTLTYAAGTGNCSVTDTKVITVYSLPSVSANDLSFCSGLNGTLTAIASGGQGIINYSWSPAIGLSASASGSVVANPLSTTTYTISITDENGCAASDNAVVTVLALPVVQAGDDLSVCNTSASTTLTGFSPAGGTWSGPNVTPPGVFSPQGLGENTLIYTYTDGNGCVNSDSILLSVTDPGSINAGLNDSVCLNAPSTQLNGLPAGGSWSGSAVVNTSGLLSPSVEGSHTLFYTAGGGTCAITDSVIITILPLPEVTGPGATICRNDSITLTVQGSSGSGSYVYSWSPAQSLSTVSGSSVQAFPNSTQVYTVTIVDEAQCTGSTEIEVLVNSLPVVNAGSDSIICFTPIPTVLIGAPLNGTWTGTGVSGDQYIPVVPGTETLVYSFTDGNGCTNTDSLEIVANNPDSVYAGADTSVCLGAIAFAISGQSPSGGSWTGNAQISSDGIFTAINTGTLTYTYTTGSGNCAVSDDRTINVNALPVVYAGADTSVCVNSPEFIFSAENPTAGGTWLWAGAGITDGATGLFNPNTSGSGTHEAVYQYTESLTGCANSDTLLVTVNVLTPVVVSEPNLAVCLTSYNSQLTADPIGGTWTGTSLNFDYDLSSPHDTAGFIPATEGSFSSVYTFSDQNQCVNADTVTITVSVPVDAYAGPDISFCLNSTDTFQLTGTPPTGTWTDDQNPTWVSSDGLLSTSLADTADVIFTVGVGSCQTWDTTLVVIFPLPFISAGTDTFRCLEDACFLLNQPIPLGGIWSGNGITDASTGTFCSLVSGEGIQSIYYDIDTTYYYSNLNSVCHSSDSIDVLVVPMPSPALLIDSVLCVNTIYQLGNISSGPSSEFEWTIIDLSGQDTVFHSSEVSPEINLTTAGSYRLYLSSTTPYGCSVETSGDFIVAIPPEPYFEISDDLACAPYQGVLYNASAGYSITYLWDFGDLFPTSTDTTPVMPVFPSPVWGDSLYYVQLSLTNLCGTRTYLDSVMVRPQPVADIATDHSLGCSPDEFILQNVSYGSPESFLWNFGNGITSLDSLPSNVSYSVQNTAQEFIISVQVTNSCGTDSDTTIITVLPSSISMDNLLPESACAPFTFTFQSPDSDQSYYLWNFGDGTGGTSDSITHEYTVPGTYAVELTVSNFCFTDTVSGSFNLLPGPDLGFNMSATGICQNETVTLTNTSLNGTGFQWIIPNQVVTYTSIISEQFNSGGLIDVGLSGTHPVNGCVDTVFQTINVIERPDIIASADPDTGCFKLLAHFNNITQGANAYQWIFSDGSGSSESEPTVLINSVGLFTAELIAHNYQSSVIDCPDTLNINVWVNPSPISSFSIAAEAGCGPPATVQTLNQSSDAVISEWTWEGNISNDNSPNLIFQDTGSHTISLRVANEFNCADTSSTDFIVFGQPDLQFNLAPVEGCPPLNVLFQNLTQYGDSVRWGFGDGNFSDLTSEEHLYLTPGYYPVELFVSTGNGLCYDDTMALQAIHVYPVATASFVVEPTEINEDIPVVNLINYSDEFSTLMFYEDTVYFSSTLPPTYAFLDPDTGFAYLVLIANNEFNCPDTAINTITIKPSPNVYFPEAFTPNSDGVNDKFRIIFDRAPTYYYVSIYDRWGHIVFSSFDYEEAWDGTFKNNGNTLLKSDVYVLKLSALFEGTLKISELFHNVVLVR